MEKLVVPVKSESIGLILDYIENTLISLKFKRKEINDALLISEETIIKLIENSDGGDFHVSIKNKLKKCTIAISAPGKEFQINSFDIGLDLENIGDDRESESAIRKLLLDSYSNKIKYVNREKYNFVQISAGSQEHLLTVATMLVFLIAALTGLLLKSVLSESTCINIDTYLLVPIETIFINSLKLTVAPMVFLSILSNMAKYSSIRSSSKISIKVIGLCILTSVFAVFTGFFSFKLFSPGVAGELSEFVGKVGKASIGISSAKDAVDTIVNTVPDNFIEPFLNVDSLQLIFIALVCGIALGRAGEYSKTLNSAVQAFETLSYKVSEILYKMVPFVVFFSTISLIFNTNLHTIMSLLKMILTLLAAFLTMFILYLVMIAVFARINPIHFLKKYAPTMKATFFAGSAMSMLSKTMGCCKNKLGISEKVYSFAIPFGAMANMDGNCIYLTVASLFMAKMCGVEVFNAGFLPLLFSIVVLSMGASIAPGSVLICMSVLLNQLNISTTAICIILGVNAIVEMVLAVSDTFGDVAVSLIVAKSEKLLNTEIYNSKR